MFSYELPLISDFLYIVLFCVFMLTAAAHDNGQSSCIFQAVVTAGNMK